MYENQYVIVELTQPSYEHGFLFWKPESKGYTSDLKQAGSWTKEKAMELTQNNNSQDKIAICYDELMENCKIKKIIDYKELNKFKKILTPKTNEEHNVIR